MGEVEFDRNFEEIWAATRLSMVHRHFGKISRLESVGISKMRRKHLHVRRQSSPTHNPASNTQTPNLGKGLANTFPKEAPNEQIHSIRECTHPVCAQPQARSASWERTGKVRFVRNIRSGFKNYSQGVFNGRLVGGAANRSRSGPLPRILVLGPESFSTQARQRKPLRQ